MRPGPVRSGPVAVSRPAGRWPVSGRGGAEPVGRGRRVAAAGPWPRSARPGWRAAGRPGLAAASGGSGAVAGRAVGHGVIGRQRAQRLRSGALASAGISGRGSAQSDGGLGPVRRGLAASRAGVPAGSRHLAGRGIVGQPGDSTVKSDTGNAGRGGIGRRGTRPRIAGSVGPRPRGHRPGRTCGRRDLGGGDPGRSGGGGPAVGRPGSHRGALPASGRRCRLRAVASGPAARGPRQVGAAGGQGGAATGQGAEPYG